MGRPAKYLTHEDRLRARRLRRAAQSHLPEVQTARKRHYRKWYEKKRGNKLLDSPPLDVDESIRTLAEMELPSPEYSYLLRQLVQGRDSISLDERDIEEEDFKALTGLPPYPQEIVSIASFEDDWAMLSTAMHGYAIKRYLEYLEELSRSSTRKQPTSIIFDLVQERRRMEFKYGLLERAHKSYIELGKNREAKLAGHNLKWHCRVMEYNRKDIETLKTGFGGFLQEVLERKWALGRVIQGM